MADKLKYAKPTIQINEFSVNDVIRVSDIPCPGSHEPCFTDIDSLDDQILNGTIK